LYYFKFFLDKSNIRNSISSLPYSKKYKTVEKIFSELKLKLDKFDKRLKGSLIEVNNNSIQTYLKETKILANKSNNVNSDESGHLKNKGNIKKIKLANLFESLPNFNNSIYKKSKISENQNASSLNVKPTSKAPKLPLIGNTEKSRANESIRNSFDFCQNTTQISYLGNYFNTPIKANHMSDLYLNYTNNSNRGTTLTFNPKNINLKLRTSQINLKNLKSHYEENFKSKYSIFKDFKKANNISDSIALNKNTIIDKIGNFKNTLKEILSKHYLSTEDFNQISPRKFNFNYNEDEQIN
jgi:hypothetical protein